MSVWNDADFWRGLTLASKADFSKRFVSQKFYVPMLIDGKDDAMILYRLRQTAIQPYDWRFLISQKMSFQVEFREQTVWKPKHHPRPYGGMASEVTYQIRKNDLVIYKTSALEEVEELLCILKLTMS